MNFFFPVDPGKLAPAPFSEEVGGRAVESLSWDAEVSAGDDAAGALTMAFSSVAGSGVPLPKGVKASLF